MKTGIGWTKLTKRSAPNFIGDNGNVFLVRCPKCNSENYAMAVSSGICAWCGFDLNKSEEELTVKETEK